MITQITIDEFLAGVNICAEGVIAMQEVGTYGLSVDEAAQKLKEAGQRDFAAWLLSQKNTEAYVRFNGSQFTMGAYQIHNPLTGQHIRCETEEAAKAALVQLATEILAIHRPTVVQELSNEHGDSTWITVEIPNAVQVIPG